MRKENPLTKRRLIESYDPNILCKDCDNYLGKFDQYAKEVFVDRKHIKETIYRHGSQKEVTYSLIDIRKYDIIYRFMLSVL